MEDRRDALKIIGAISATCAFPFAADELYGQHVHPQPGAPATLPLKPEFFTAAEFAVISRIADLIIPATDTPGALAAGAPSYIDWVVTRNTVHQKPLRDALANLPADFLNWTEERQTALLLKAEADKAQWFVTLKALTADGYYTSKIGLLEELGYKGNTVLAEFPDCSIPEH